MTKRQKDSARLIWVDAFMAAAAYENYTEAEKILRISATSVQRQLLALEIWLHRVLLVRQSHHDLTKPLELTEDGEEFAPKAMRIVNLIDEGGLKNEISITRVHSNGSINIGGKILRSSINSEIGKLMIGSRAIVDPNKPSYKPTPADPAIFHFIISKLMEKSK